MLLSFITAYVDNDSKLEKNLKKISKRYLYNDFIIDLIPLIPTSKLFHFNFSRYLYFIKCIRIFKVFKILDVKRLNRNVKVVFKNKHAEVCQDPKRAHEKDIDYNHIVDQIMIKNVIITFRLVASTCIGGWFFGLFFFVYCDIFSDLNDNYS